MTKTIRVALLCFDNPFTPPSEGGKRGILTRIKSLSLIKDITVDVYLLTKRSEKLATSFYGLEAGNCKFYQYRMNKTLSSLVGNLPVCVNKRFVKMCAEEISQHEYDVAIYEGAQVSEYRFKNVVNAKVHILYMHDIESKYRMEMSASQKGLHKIANRIESFKFRKIEQKLAVYFDRLWFVSCDECDEFNKWADSNGKCIYIPFPALNIADRPVQGITSHEVVYIGDLTIQHNYLSLKWFIENVWNKIDLEGITPTMKVIGRIGEADKSELHRMGVQVCGYVDDIDAVYSSANCIVAPILYGAGVKVKTVDAVARGQIVVTTKKGIEGTELKSGVHLIAEDDPEILKSYCERILRNRSQYEFLASHGLAFVRSNHTIDEQATIISNEITRLLGNWSAS